MTLRLDDIEVKMMGRTPEQNMRLLFGRYNGPTIIVPQPNKYYVFVYNAKTKGLEYDQHPVIISGSIFNWGFTGFNIHWGEMRRYTWKESSNLLELSEAEFEVVSKLPLAKFKTA
jgi:hypothetical protein